MLFFNIEETATFNIIVAANLRANTAVGTASLIRAEQ